MPNEISRIRIHPGIGIARLGNSDEFYIGPESPGSVVNPGGKNGPGPDGGTYRDAKGALKRQAQRYRVYAYNADGEVVKELSLDSDLVKSMRWRVHVRNMKAANYAFQGAYLFDPDKLRNPTVQPDKKPNERDKLIIDAGVCHIATGDNGPVVMKGDVFDGIGTVKLPGALRFEGFTPKDVSQEVDVTYKAAKDIELGQLRLDDQGRLLFVAAPGKSDSVTTPRVLLSNPSETINPPNGAEDGKNPLTNQFAYFNVPGWWDDTCGGEIDVTVELHDGTVLSTRNDVTALADEGKRNPHNGAWIVTAPPKFSPYMYHVVSILDRVYEAFPESYPNAKKKTNFYRDIYPIFANAVASGWTGLEASGTISQTKGAAHGPTQPGNLLNPQLIAAFTDTSDKSKDKRQFVYNLMRHAPGNRGRLVDSLMPPPPQRPTSWKNEEFQRKEQQFLMPRLWGTGGKPLQNKQLGNHLPDEFLSLTTWQLNHMKEWAEGNFEVGELSQAVPLDKLPLSEQPLALDSSAVQPTVGGGFHPGIEFPYLIIYAEFFAEAFRVNDTVEPGALAAFMSSPWQGDFWSCNQAWWPAQRPDIVFEFDSTNQIKAYKEWFRGYDESGTPLSNTDGYNQMVYAWPHLGMILPVKDEKGEYIKNNGDTIFAEFERNPILDDPSKKSEK